MTQTQLCPLVAYKQQHPIDKNKEHVLPWGRLIAFQKCKVISFTVCWITKVCKIIPVMRDNAFSIRIAKRNKKAIVKQRSA